MATGPSARETAPPEHRHWAACARCGISKVLLAKTYLQAFRHNRQLAVLPVHNLCHLEIRYQARRWFRQNRIGANLLGNIEIIVLFAASGNYHGDTAHQDNNGNKAARDHHTLQASLAYLQVEAATHISATPKVTAERARP